MTVQTTTFGNGPPLVLLHGLGGTGESWAPIRDALAARHRLIVPDLPGHGRSPLPDPVAFAGIAGAMATWWREQGLDGVPVVGMSLGGRVAIELARQGMTGPVVALAPGGFWQDWERQHLLSTLPAAVQLARALLPTLPLLAAQPQGRLALLMQFSARPVEAPSGPVAAELTSAAQSPAIDSLILDMALAPAQTGFHSGPPVRLVWGREDRVCLPQQAERAAVALPDAELHWLERCGHYQLWDAPEAVTSLILEFVGPRVSEN